MMGDLRVVTDEMMEKVERQQSEADDVSHSIQELLGRIDDVEMQLMDLPREFDPSDPLSVERTLACTLASVVNARQMGLIAVAHRVSELSDADVEAIERLVNTTPSVVEYVRNRREVQAWQGLLSIAFEDGSDIVGAVRSVTVTRQATGGRTYSVRDIATRFARTPNGSQTCAGNRSKRSRRRDN